MSVITGTRGLALATSLIAGGTGIVTHTYLRSNSGAVGQSDHDSNTFVSNIPSGGYLVKNIAGFGGVVAGGVIGWMALRQRREDDLSVQSDGSDKSYVNLQYTPLTPLRVEEAGVLPAASIERVPEYDPNQVIPHVSDEASPNGSRIKGPTIIPILTEANLDLMNVTDVDMHSITEAQLSELAIGGYLDINDNYVATSIGDLRRLDELGIDYSGIKVSIRGILRLNSGARVSHAISGRVETVSEDGSLVIKSRLSGTKNIKLSDPGTYISNGWFQFKLRG